MIAPNYLCEISFEESKPESINCRTFSVAGFGMTSTCADAVAVVWLFRTNVAVPYVIGVECADGLPGLTAGGSKNLLGRAGCNVAGVSGTNCADGLGVP